MALFCVCSPRSGCFGNRPLLSLTGLFLVLGPKMAVLVLIEMSECNVCIFGWQQDTQRTGSDEAQSSEEKVTSSGTNLKKVPFMISIMNHIITCTGKPYHPVTKVLHLRACLQCDNCCIHLHTTSCLQCAEILQRVFHQKLMFVHWGKKSRNGANTFHHALQCPLISGRLRCLGNHTAAPENNRRDK